MSHSIIKTVSSLRTNKKEQEEDRLQAQAVQVGRRLPSMAVEPQVIGARRVHGDEDEGGGALRAVTACRQGQEGCGEHQEPEADLSSSFWVVGGHGCAFLV